MPIEIILNREKGDLIVLRDSSVDRDSNINYLTKLLTIVYGFENAVFTCYELHSKITCIVSGINNTDLKTLKEKIYKEFP